MAKKGSSNKIKTEKISKSNVKTSDICEDCMKCEKGKLYVLKMSKPNSVGYGVHCPL